MQYRADCVTAINNFIGQVKIELVARVLRKVLKLAVEHTDGYRIWTANWPASCQDELDSHIQDACRKVTPAALRTQLVTVQEFFITALRQMWALKSLIPLHIQIASRLDGDMSSLAHLYIHIGGIPRPTSRTHPFRRPQSVPPANRPRSAGRRKQLHRRVGTRTIAKSKSIIPSTPLITSYYNSVHGTHVDQRTPQAVARPPHPPRDDG